MTTNIRKKPFLQKVLDFFRKDKFKRSTFSEVRIRYKAGKIYGSSVPVNKKAILITKIR